MAIGIRPLHPVFVGEVAGADLTRPQTETEIAAIEAGMVVHSRAYEGNLVRLAVSGPASLLGRLRKYRLRDE